MPPLNLTVKPVGIAARKAAAQAALATTEPKFQITITPEQATHRIGIVFDDSTSMNSGYPESLISQARKGVEEFLRNCRPNQTAVCVYPMSGNAIKLSADLPSIALAVQKIDTIGYTPLCETAIKMLGVEKLTRAIVFSDGQPDSEREYHKLVSSAKKQKIPIDTVFLGSSYGKIFMEHLAQDTGGIFLHFDPAKSNFAASFKYLTPGYRALLADKSFVAKLEGK